MKLFIYINLRNLLDDWETCGTKIMEVALKEIFSLHFFFHMYIWELIYFITILMKKKRLRRYILESVIAVHLKLAHFTRS